MFFKEWCLSVYKISSFSEAKIIDCVFLPAISKNRPFLDNLMLIYDGYMATHKNTKGLIFTKDKYERLIKMLAHQFQMLNPEIIDDDNCTDYINRYFSQWGFNFNDIQQYRTPPGIHIKIDGQQEKHTFMKQFSRFKPRLKYDAVNQTDVIQMPTSFLNHLYAVYNNTITTQQSPTRLPGLEEQEQCLKQLSGHLDRKNMSRFMDSSQRLALDYDNNGLKDPEASSTYAMSLKIYAELHKEGLSPADYRSFYAAATLLAAYNQQGYLRQSLKTDAIFIDYLKWDIYFKCLKTISYNEKTKEYLLLDELPDDTKKVIFDEINAHTEHMLHGNSKVRLGKNTYLATSRFLPDNHNQSDTDEIIFASGGMHGHLANFRLVKVGMLVNGQKASIHDNPHHYEYFKIENNLGAYCHEFNSQTKTCIGTYVTRIMPCIYTSTHELQHSNINPYTHLHDYQFAMEKTLKALIKIERILLFYRPDSPVNDASDNNKEKSKWLYFHRLATYLSGTPYTKPVTYYAQDALQPWIKYHRMVQNQKSYIQEGGSCTIFSIKSLLNSVIGHELTALHTHFMQQHNASGYKLALEEKIAGCRKAINAFSPLFITGINYDVNQWVNAFKRFLNANNGPVTGMTILATENPGICTIALNTPWLKNRWHDFIAKRNMENNSGRNINPHQFFNPMQKYNALPDIGNQNIGYPQC